MARIEVEVERLKWEFYLPAPYIALEMTTERTTSDFAIVTTVKCGFAPRLPSDLVGLILEYTNWANAERKRAWLSKISMLRNIWNVHIIERTPTETIYVQCPPEYRLRECGAPLLRIWTRFLNNGVIL